MAKVPQGPGEGEVRIERHRAERLADFVVVGSVCCSSCCCCCCCVHAIGGVAGAAAGSAMALTATASNREATRGVHLVNAVYWMGFIAAAFFTGLIGLLADAFWWTMLVVALGAPFFQLGMSVLVAPVAALQPPARREGAFIALRNMSAGTVLGAIGGTVVFVVLGGVVSVLAMAFK